MLKFQTISKGCYKDFMSLLTEYYREGEDADTNQTVINEFIARLYELIEQNKICGRLVLQGEVVVGFVLWMLDTAESEFSELPGYGTILEIGVSKENRLKGIGTQIVDYVENLMQKSGIKNFYVSAYEPASVFWEKCKYIKTTNKASNDLFIYKKCV